MHRNIWRHRNGSAPSAFLDTHLLSLPTYSWGLLADAFFLFCQCSMLPVVILGTMNDIISYIATYIHIYIATYIYIYIYIYISDEFVKVQLFVMQSSAGRRVVCSARGGLSCVCYNGTLYPSNEGNPLVFWWIAVTLLWPGRGDFSASGLSTFKKIALTLALDCTIWDFTMSFSPLK